MANVDLAIRYSPQQGHTTVQHEGQEYGLRVTTEPTEHGEKVTLRLQQNEAGAERDPAAGGVKAAS